jgi:hypothetical protein
MKTNIEGSQFSEVGILERDGSVLCREYMVQRSGVLFDLTAGTQEYVDSLVRLNPEFATEPILIVDGEILAQAQIAAEHLARVPDIERYLVEQSSLAQD